MDCDLSYKSAGLCHHTLEGFSDADLAAMAHLRLSFAVVDARVLEVVARATKLREIVLQGCRLSLDLCGMLSLVSFAELTCLDLSGCFVKNEGLALLKLPPGLERLNLCFCNLTELSPLLNLSSLVVLDVSHNKLSPEVGGAQLKQLVSSCAGLKEIRAYNCGALGNANVKELCMVSPTRRRLSVFVYLLVLTKT
jgi:hypothetical protein